MNGYKTMHPVPIEARAEMLESWAGYESQQVERELSFAVLSVDWNDPDTLRWLACGIERRLTDIQTTTKARLEELRAAIQAESISYGEIAELQGLAEHIEPGDVELLEWAGVPEFGEEV